MDSNESTKRTYEPRLVVGDFFEKRVMLLFDLVRADVENTGEVPDLVSRTGSFFVEVKASAYRNGGVIKRKQLYKFDEEICVRRFYAFAYHPICEDMLRNYPSKVGLRRALDLKSVYLFPFSIVRAHFESSNKRRHSDYDEFVQLREWQARAIFEGDEEIWLKLGLCQKEYEAEIPSEGIYVMTRQGYLKKEILSSFKTRDL